VEVDRVRALESQGDISNLTYNQDGTISQVEFRDGTSASYSYNYSADGAINNCEVSTGRTTVGFVANARGAVGQVYVRTAEGEDERSKPVLVVDVSGIGPKIDEVSRKPVPYELLSGINKSLDDLALAKRKAAEEFQDSSQKYYDLVLSSIESNKDKLATGGIKIERMLKEATGQNVSAAQRREAIDDMVAYIYTEAADKEKAESAAEFIGQEKGVRAKFLTPAIAAYEDKVKNALAYVHKIIDNLLRSKLALYMSANKEKIEALINLPKIKDPSKK
jgi:hypothetical protein